MAPAWSDPGMKLSVWPLLPLSALYGLAMRIRNWHYDRAASVVRVGAPVLSVGNITVGGTGKTPLVIELVRRLLAVGRRPAVLTRGYGAAGGSTADEVAELRLAIPAVPVLAGADRADRARRALAENAADCFVLDDGFQHRRIGRDLDLVVIDTLAPWGGGRVLPAGRLREPLDALRRADVVVLSRANQAVPAVLAEIEAVLRRLVPSAALLGSRVEASGVAGQDGASVEVESLAARTVLPVCGIGNPRTFARLVEVLAPRRVEPLVYCDHHAYTAADVAAIVDAARRRGAHAVLTTRKDWVKLAPLWGQQAPQTAGLELLRLDIRHVIEDEAGVLDGLVARARAGAAGKA
jgi:tetraacyldisaccharide 4'-kinase